MTAAPDPLNLLREGETCWRTAHADRVAFLIDGESYFGAVADALENARESVWLLGWDFHSAVRLRRDGDSERPVELSKLLDALVRERPSLHVRVLGWDFAMLYALEREFLPLLQFGAKTHRHIHFALDSAHPPLASQHQKIVVVDDAIAFSGGLDLTAHRWDTREHRPEDPRRETPSGKRYAPFHDVQIAVDGEAARALADLARERWRRATGRQVEPTRIANDPWPGKLEPRVRDVTVGISRTVASYRSEPEVREVEALYRESVAAARRWIYIENQYLTSSGIGLALAERLREPDGPEVLIIGPRENSGWLEENTMGALRDRFVRDLREADGHERLRVMYPEIDSLPEGQMVNVHSKVMVVDDDLARVGSSNLSNRSLGLDTECDVSIESGGEERLRRAIAGFRNDLLAEHLGTSAERVAEAIEQTGSLVRAVDSLAGGERTLLPLEVDVDRWTADAVDALGAVDPEHPVPLEELVTRFEEEGGDSATSMHAPSWSRFAVVLLVFGGLALAWRFTPLGDWATPERLGGILAFFQQSWYGPLAAGAIFTLAALLLAPVTALTVATGLALGPGVGIVVAWLGGVVSAAIGYAAGRLLWRDAVRRLAGDRLNALSRRLARRGIVSSALIRVLPIAPFMVVNLVAGASHVRARDFTVGTALGMLPGTVVLILAADGIKSAVSALGDDAWIWAGAAVVAVVGAVAAYRWLSRRRKSASAQTI